MKFRPPFAILLGALLGASVAFGATTPCPENFAGLLTGPRAQSVRSTANVHDFQKQHLVFSAIGPEHNRQYISLAQNRGLVFLDVENAILKELNDKVLKDKDLVTAVTNLHKEIFLRNLDSDPVLREAVRAKYSDFKSIRFALQATNGLEERLLRIHAKSADEFLAKIKELGIHPTPDKARGLALTPENWHLAGIGSTPDEAGAAARRSRSIDAQHGTIRPHTFEETLPVLRKTLESTEELRKLVELKFASVPGVMDDGKPAVLSAEAIALVRKISAKDRDEFLTMLRSEFESVFRHRINNDDAVILRDYVTFADQFSPGIFVEKREVIDLNRGKNGIVSADFAGQNARNIRGTMAAMAEQTDPALALRLARKEENLATQTLNRRKGEFTMIVDQQGHMGSVQFSGDDGIFLPTKELDWEQKIALTRRLSEAGYPADLRVTFLPERFADTGATIPSEIRYRLIGLAEGVEKSVRKNLQGKIPRELLREILFSVDFSPHENGGDGVARLIVASPSVSKEEMAAILRALKKSVDNTGIRQGGVALARETGNR